MFGWAIIAYAAAKFQSPKIGSVVSNEGLASFISKVSEQFQSPKIGSVVSNKGVNDGNRITSVSIP